MIENDNSLENLYNQLFDLIFLVKYGYYDVTVKKDTEKISDEDFELNFTYAVSDNFFYKVFNMEHVAKFIKENPDILSFFNIDTISKNPITEPIYFNIPKKINSRRQYKMPNLYSYILTSYFISENKNEFISIFIKNKHSTSKYFNLFNFRFKITKQIQEGLLYGGNQILSTDLSNFFHTLYTHTIPWLIDGKENAKKETKEGFANNLDKVITLSQYGETHGIPTGNLTSRIIAELYMCHVDLKLEEKGFVYSRYVDDITYSFTHENQKNDFLKEYGLICRKLNLNLNENKTKVEMFPFKNNMDKTNIFKYLDNIPNKSSMNTWITELNSLIDICTSQEAIGNKGSIKSLFSEIPNQLIKREFNSTFINNIFTNRNNITGFNLINKIIDISMKDSILTNKFISFIENIHKIGVSNSDICIVIDEYFDNNKNTIETNFKHYIHMNYNQEIYQILLYLVEFNINYFFSNETILEYLNKDLDDYSLCLLLILYLKQNGDIKLLLHIVDDKFKINHLQYPINKPRMTETLWLFRYFFYSLIENEIIKKREVNKYCKYKEYESNKRGYKSELNWDFIKNNTDENNLDKFYDELLKNKVLLVHFGKDNSFVYLQ